MYVCHNARLRQRQNLYLKKNNLQKSTTPGSNHTIADRLLGSQWKFEKEIRWHYLSSYSPFLPDNLPHENSPHYILPHGHFTPRAFRPTDSLPHGQLGTWTTRHMVRCCLTILLYHTHHECTLSKKNSENFRNFSIYLSVPKDSVRLGWFKNMHTFCAIIFVYEPVQRNRRFELRWTFHTVPRPGS
jgi:hypothetical protein